MLNRQAGKSAEQSPQVTQVLRHQHCERVKQIHQILHTSSLEKYSYTFIDSLYGESTAILYDLERQPEDIFKALIEVIGGLREVRNELRHVRFLFEVQEINPVHRLVMRNRAALRGKDLLQKIILVWPRR
jgi:hypothetical protein